MVGKRKKKNLIIEVKKNQKHRKDQMLKKTNLTGIHRIYGINQAINPIGIEEMEVEPGSSNLNIFIADIGLRAHYHLGHNLWFCSYSSLWPTSMWCSREFLNFKSERSAS